MMPISGYWLSAVGAWHYFSLLKGHHLDSAKNFLTSAEPEILNFMQISKVLQILCSTFYFVFVFKISGLTAGKAFFAELKMVSL
jgi:hypothetical protein